MESHMSIFNKLQLIKGMERVEVEKRIATLLGKPMSYSPYTHTPDGGMVRYPHAQWVLEVVYKAGDLDPVPTATEVEANKRLLPIYETLLEYKIKKRVFEKRAYNYGDTITLNINEITPINDIFLEVIFFRHKRPFVGGGTHATADLIVSDGVTSKRISLSVRGVQGKSELEDGLSKKERFSSVTWKEYTIELVKKFNYGKSIEVVVLKDEKELTQKIEKIGNIDKNE